MKKIIISLAAVAVLAIAAFILVSWCSGPPARGVSCQFHLERGWGVSRISRALADSGLVRCRYYFLWRYSRMEGKPPLQAGRYLLDDGMSPDSILGILSRGEVIPVPTSWVTLPPGLTLQQSLDVIDSSTVLERSRLDSLASDSEFLAHLGIPTLEGYLFPETYEFADTMSAEQVIGHIVRTGLSEWPEDMDSCIESTGLSIYETLILASIVEREAKVDSERPVIAGVFLSRLRIGMMLESCATVQYALGHVKKVLLYSDLQVDSPYNTYRHQGLPPGPICSPGLPSIDAAFHPDTTGGYLYFVSREDGSGTHLFARTHQQHLANIRSIPGR